MATTDVEDIDDIRLATVPGPALKMVYKYMEAHHNAPAQAVPKVCLCAARWPWAWLRWLVLNALWCAAYPT